MAGITAAAVIGGKILYETFKTEPVHAVFPIDAEDKIKQQFLEDRGHFLEPLQEFKQINQRWGVTFKLDREHELHVRAHNHGPDQISLSAHAEFSRDTIKHGLMEGDYQTGQKLLVAYLQQSGLSSFQIK